MPRESAFQARVCRDLEREYSGILILPMFVQGLPDRLLLFNDRWAFLEFKRSLGAPVQPNQEYYVALLCRMSFAAFICPENELEVLGELERALRPQW